MDILGILSIIGAGLISNTRQVHPPVESPARCPVRQEVVLGGAPPTRHILPRTLTRATSLAATTLCPPPALPDSGTKILATWLPSPALVIDHLKVLRLLAPPKALPIQGAPCVPLPVHLTW